MSFGMAFFAMSGSADQGGNDAFTKVLLHFDGANSSTTITDSNAGGAAKTWTANGNAQITTSGPKFGTGCLICDGTGDDVSTPDSAEFALAALDWEADCWFDVNAAGNGTVRWLFGQGDNAGLATNISIMCRVHSTNVAQLTAYVGSTAYTVASTTAITTSGLNHIAVGRSGDNLYLKLNGVLEATLPITGSINNSTSPFHVGGTATSTNKFYGKVDEFRLSVGIARWTSNFTPPSEAYK